MKKYLLAFLLCCALVCLSACGTAPTQTTTEPPTADQTAADEPDAPAQTQTGTEEATEPETFAAATVSVRFIAPDLLEAGQYESFDTGAESSSTHILFSTNATVRDFKVLELSNGDVGDDGEMHFDVRELYAMDRLTPDRPLLVKTAFYGLIPNNGVSYVDETGATRTFAVDMSGEDGSLYLWEIN